MFRFLDPAGKRFLWIFVIVAGHLASAYGQPVISKQPAGLVMVQLGSEAQINVEAQGDGLLEFQWRLNGVNLPGETNSILSIKNVLPDDCGTYTVAVSDDKGSVNSSPSRLIPSVTFYQGADFFIQPFDIDERKELNPNQGILRSSNTNATSEVGEPQHAGQRGGKSIWYRWIAPTTGIVTFTARGSGFDTLLAAYFGQGFEDLQLVSKTSQDDDFGDFLTSKISFNAIGDTEYFIAVDGFEGGTGDIILRWNLEGTEDRLPEILALPLSKTVGPETFLQLSAPFEGGFGRWFRDGGITETTGDKYTIDKVTADDVGRYLIKVTSEKERQVASIPADIQINITDGETDETVAALDKFLGLTEDNREKRKGVVVQSSGPSRGYSTTQIFSTVGATKDAGEPNHCGVVGGCSEWYSYAAPANGTVHISTDGSSYNTVLAVYTGTGFDYASLTGVASNNVALPTGGDRVRFTATSGTIYFIAVDGVGGASGTVQLNINLGDSPVITAHPIPKTLPVGTNVTFTVSATGTSPFAYQWKRNGNVIAGATNSFYTLTNLVKTNTANYQVVVSNIINIATSTNALLTVLIPPSISLHPSSQTVNAGDNTSFTVTASGDNLRYQWKFNNTNLLNQTNATLNLTNVQSGNVGSYNVVVTNAVGTVTSSSASLSISAPPVITSQPASRTVGPGETIALTVTATGTPEPTYQWHFNLLSISGATNSSLVITNFQDANEGSYYVVVTNSMGSVTSSNATLAANSPVRMDSFTRDSDGTIHFQLIGAAGSNYVLQASTNLVNWVPLATNTTANGFLDFTDPTAPGFISRFYRISSP